MDADSGQIDRPRSILKQEPAIRGISNTHEGFRAS